MDNRYSFENIVDIIGPISAWPSKILERYLKDSYKSEDRFALCLFNFTNGLDNSLFLEFAQTHGKLRDEAAVQHIRTISAMLERRVEHLNDYYSFNIQENRWTYLNGQTKHYWWSYLKFR